jgi:hypothetical protein
MAKFSLRRLYVASMHSLEWISFVTSEDNIGIYLTSGEMIRNDHIEGRTSTIKLEPDLDVQKLTILRLVCVEFYPVDLFYACVL